MIPCKNCEERNSECHAKCERYKKFYEENEKLKEAKRKAKESESCSFNSVYYTNKKTFMDKINKRH